MKKIIAFFMFAVLAVSSFAADVYKFPGWRCTDADKLAAAVAAAPNPWLKCRDSILLAMAKQKVQNYAEFCSLVDSVVEANKGTETAESVESCKNQYKKQVPFCKGIWIKEAWNFCQSKPSFYDIYFVIYKRKQIGLSDAQAYTYMVDHTLRHNNGPQIISAIVDAIIDIAPNLTGVDVKADLQKLNRKFSKNLLTNKAKWEPIIAKIRTTIETY